MIRTLLLLFVMMSACLLNAQAQRPIFLGIQPGMTVEPFYEEGEFDLNIVPLVIEKPISQRINLRLITLANYHFGAENGFSDIGGQLVAPIFIKKMESKNDLPVGFYVGPILGFGRNLINDHYTLTTGIEPGYLFDVTEKFNLSLGMQLGGSYFMYDNKPSIWRQHFGIKVNLGIWL